MSREQRTTEKSPLLNAASNSRGRPYSQSSSREEARPIDTTEDQQSYQHEHETTRRMSEESAPIMQRHTSPTNGDGDDEDDAPLINKGPMVVCRVCEAEISLEGKTSQHVVRCQQCNEVTPIRAAPPGKKYVRCPCNCLLVCKASSTRIACPRQNCRRVITLAASSPVGTAVRAPAGTCRVQCVHCLEIFMFNSLSNSVANCPHCKKISSVGARFARSRATINFIALGITLIILVGLIIGTLNSNGNMLMYSLWVLLSITSAYFLFRFVHYARMKISQVLGPI